MPEDNIFVQTNQENQFLGTLIWKVLDFLSFGQLESKASEQAAGTNNNQNKKPDEKKKQQPEEKPKIQSKQSEIKVDTTNKKEPEVKKQP